MFKYLLLLGAVLFAVPVFATSGACAYHGGVDCDYSTASGHAVCQDGAVSSVMYNSMVMCQSDLPSCQYPIAYGCTSQSDLQFYQSNYQSMANGITLAGGSASSVDNSSIQRCQNEIDQYQQQMSQYSSCKQQVQQYQVQRLSALCATASPEHGSVYYSNGSCQLNCDSGYTADYSDYDCLAPISTVQMPEPVVVQPVIPAPVPPPASSSVAVGKPTPVKVLEKPKTLVSTTTTIAATTSAPRPVEVPVDKHGFWYWFNPLNWF